MFIYRERHRAAGIPDQPFAVTAAQIETVRRAVKSLEKQRVVRKSKHLIYSNSKHIKTRGWELTGKVPDALPTNHNPGVGGPPKPCQVKE
jgi:hypothetical protein